MNFEKLKELLTAIGGAAPYLLALFEKILEIFNRPEMRAKYAGLQAKGKYAMAKECCEEICARLECQRADLSEAMALILCAYLDNECLASCIEECKE